MLRKEIFCVEHMLRKEHHLDDLLKGKLMSASCWKGNLLHQAHVRIELHVNNISEMNALSTPFWKESFMSTARSNISIPLTSNTPLAIWHMSRATWQSLHVDLNPG